MADLRTREGAKGRAEGRFTVSAGDVVTVHEDGLPRGLWRLGKIESVIPGGDGEIRAAVVKVKSKRGRTTLLKRPVQKLFPLELFSERNRQDDEPDPENDDEQLPEVSVEPAGANVSRNKPRREAALDAECIGRLIDQ